MMPLPALRAWLRTLPHPSRHFSQAEEDAVLDGLLFQLGLRDGRFVEIGVGPGTENNTRALAERGWRGIWVGDEPIVFVPRGVYPVQETVTVENIDALVGDLPVGVTIDVFSLDIDGNDYWIAERVIPRLSPTIVIVEYCHIAPPGWIMPYTPGYRWHQGELCGASLAAWQRALSQYVLVYTTQAQVNAIFVHRRVWDVDAIAVRGGVPMEDSLDRLITELGTLREGVARNEGRLSAEQICGALTRIEGLARDVRTRLAEAFADPPAPVVDTDDAGSQDDAVQLADAMGLVEVAPDPAAAEPVLSSAGVLRSDIGGPADVPTIEEGTAAGSGDASGGRPPDADPSR